MLKATAGSKHSQRTSLASEMWLLNTDTVWSITLARPWGPKEEKVKAEAADRQAGSLGIRMMSVSAADTHIQR